MIPTIGLAQSAEKKGSTQKAVSKYSVILDKNTKDQVQLEHKETDAQRQFTLQMKFDMHYTNYLNSDAKNKDFNSLLQAYEFNSFNSELYFELAKYYELTQNETKKKEFFAKLKASKLSPALREYAYNTLMSVSQNGILITYGEDDTYPIWILQSIENIRRDVIVLNYDLLINTEYRTRKKKELGLNFSKSYSSNITILKDIAVKNKNKNVYYSLTVSHLILKQLKNELYPTGLALKYSKGTFDNSQILLRNWETKFLKIYISNSTINSTDKNINMNYVLPLLQLSQYYKNNLEESKQNQLNILIRKIGESGGKQKQVEALLNK
jgi:hypothetical protein